eukprot:3325280-Alexandrium_andersonii.AAC.1
MVGPRAPPRAAAWQSERALSRARPGWCASAAPSNFWKQVGICARWRSPGNRGGALFEIRAR